MFGDIRRLRNDNHDEDRHVNVMDDLHVMRHMRGNRIAGHFRMIHHRNQEQAAAREAQRQVIQRRQMLLDPRNDDERFLNQHIRNLIDGLAENEIEELFFIGRIDGRMPENVFDHLFENHNQGPPQLKNGYQRLVLSVTEDKSTIDLFEPIVISEEGLYSLELRFKREEIEGRFVSLHIRSLDDKIHNVKVQDRSMAEASNNVSIHETTRLGCFPLRARRNNPPVVVFKMQIIKTLSDEERDQIITPRKQTFLHQQGNIVVYSNFIDRRQYILSGLLKFGHSEFFRIDRKLLVAYIDWVMCMKTIPLTKEEVFKFANVIVRYDPCRPKNLCPSAVNELFTNNFYAHAEIHNAYVWGNVAFKERMTEIQNDENLMRLFWCNNTIDVNLSLTATELKNYKHVLELNGLFWHLSIFTHVMNNKEYLAFGVHVSREKEKDWPLYRVSHTKSWNHPATICMKLHHSRGITLDFKVSRNFTNFVPTAAYPNMYLTDLLKMGNWMEDGRLSMSFSITKGFNEDTSFPGNNDLVVVCGNEGTKVHVNRDVLYEFCPYFRVFANSTFLESRFDEHPLRSFPTDAFLKIMELIYHRSGLVYFRDVEELAITADNLNCEEVMRFLDLGLTEIHMGYGEKGIEVPVDDKIVLSSLDRFPILKEHVALHRQGLLDRYYSRFMF